MSRPPAEWLRAQMRAAWWRRAPDLHFRLWLNLLAAAEPDATAGGLRVDARLDDLVASCSASRDRLRQALIDLSEMGLCRAAVSPGRAPGVVVLLAPEHERPPEQADSREPLAPIIPLFPAKDLDTAPRARDQDLQRVRSVDPGQSIHPERRQQRLDDPPRAGSERSRSLIPHTVPGGVDGPDRSSGSPQKVEASANTGPWPDGYAPLARRRSAGPRADKIPDRAWKAADYLRAQLLEQEPNCAVARAPWDGEAGWRLKWADEFRKMNEAEKWDWDEIARSLHWAFHGQGSEYRIEVESPGALRTKWDKIQRARRRQQERSAVKRGADGRPDPQAGRPTKTWTGGE